jgi:hypothetical protein
MVNMANMSVNKAIDGLETLVAATVWAIFRDLNK